MRHTLADPPSLSLSRARALPAELAKLIDDVKPFLKTVSKAKGSKLFRNLINSFLSLPDEKARQVCRRDRSSPGVPQAL